MRQGQQGRRGRGRNNNNNNNQRKGQHHHNPLMRTFQSNGPDQKIHGTPAQIAEKYMTLARDALSSGDPVLAENYLQHAEHYNRIILTYREQQMLQQGGSDPMNGRPRSMPGSEPFDAGDEGGGDDDGEDGHSDLGGQSRGADFQPRGFEPQPGGQRFGTDERPQMPRQQYEGGREQGFRDREPGYQGGGQSRDQSRDNVPREGGYRGEGGPRDRDGGHRQNFRQRMGGDRDQRAYGGDRMPRGDRQDRPPRVDRQEGYRADRGERQERFDRGDRGDRGDRPERVERAPERVERPERQAEAGFTDRGAVERPTFERPAEPIVPVADSAIPPIPVEPAAAPAASAPRRRERFADTQHEQPEFLRRPVRRPRRESPAAATETPPAPVAADEPGTRE